MLDWRQAIDEMRHLTSIAREKGDTDFSLTDIDNYLDHLTTTFTQIENKENIKAENQKSDFLVFLEKQKELITTSYTQAHHYTTVIIFGGYAALFALWNFTKEVLQGWQVFFIGLFITISMTLYVSIEIYGAWRRGTEAQKQMNSLNEAKELGRYPDNYGQAEITRANHFMSIWRFFFITTVFFAVLAALLLIYSFINGIIYNLL